jgi:hypothetical protein
VAGHSTSLKGIVFSLFGFGGKLQGGVVFTKNISEDILSG